MKILFGIIIGMFLIPFILTLKDELYIKGNGIKGLKENPLLFFENTLRRMLK